MSTIEFCGTEAVWKEYLSCSSGAISGLTKELLSDTTGGDVADDITPSGGLSCLLDWASIVGATVVTEAALFIEGT